MSVPEYDLRPLGDIFSMCKVTQKAVTCSAGFIAGFQWLEVFKMEPNSRYRSDVQKKLHDIYAEVGLKVQAPLFWLFVPQFISSDESRKGLLRWVYREDIPAGRDESNLSWLNEAFLDPMPCKPRIERMIDGGSQLLWTGQEDLLVNFLDHIDSLYLCKQYSTRCDYALHYSNHWKRPDRNFRHIAYPIPPPDPNSSNPPELGVIPVPVAQQAPQDVQRSVVAVGVGPAVAPEGEQQVSRQDARQAPQNVQQPSVAPNAEQQVAPPQPLVERTSQASRPLLNINAKPWFPNDYATMSRCQEQEPRGGSFQTNYNLIILCRIFPMCQVTRRIIQGSDFGFQALEVFKMIPIDHDQVQQELARIYRRRGIVLQAPKYWLFIPQIIGSLPMENQLLLRWAYPEKMPNFAKNRSDIRWLTQGYLNKMPCYPKVHPRSADPMWTGQENLLVTFLDYISCHYQGEGEYLSRQHYANEYSKFWGLKYAGQDALYPEIDYPINDFEQASGGEIDVIPVPVAPQAPQGSMFWNSHWQQQVMPHSQYPNSYPTYNPPNYGQEPDQNLNTGRSTEQQSLWFLGPMREKWPEFTATPLPTQLRASCLANSQGGPTAQEAAEATPELAGLNPHQAALCSIYFSATKKLITRCIVQFWPTKHDKPKRPLVQINFPVNYRPSKALRRVFPKMQEEDWRGTSFCRKMTPDTDVAFFLRLYSDDIACVTMLNQYQAVIGCAKQNGYSKIAFHSSPGNAPIWPFIQLWVVSPRNFVEYKEDYFAPRIAKFIDKGYNAASYWCRQIQQDQQAQGEAQGQALPTAQERAQLPCPASLMDDLRSDIKKAIYVLAHLILHNADKVVKPPCEAKVFADLSELKPLLDLAIQKYREYVSVDRQEHELLRCIDDPLWAITPESEKTPRTHLDDEPTVLEYEGACMIYRSRRCQWQSCTVKWKFTLDKANFHGLEGASQYNPNDKAKVEGCVNGKLLLTIERKRILYIIREDHQFYKDDQHGLTIYCLSEYFHLRFSSNHDCYRFWFNLDNMLMSGADPKLYLSDKFANDLLEGVDVDTVEKIWRLNEKKLELENRHDAVARNVDKFHGNGKIKAKILKLIDHNFRWLSFKVLNRYALKLALEVANEIVLKRSLSEKQVESVQAYTQVYHHACQWYHIPAGELASCECCFCQVQLNDAFDEVISKNGRINLYAASYSAMSKLAFKHELLICMGECSYFDDPV